MAVRIQSVQSWINGIMGSKLPAFLMPDDRVKRQEKAVRIILNLGDFHGSKLLNDPPIQRILYDLCLVISF